MTAWRPCAVVARFAGVNRNLAPGAADIVFLVVAPLTALTRAIKLTHSDGDLAAHIRVGTEILATGRIPNHSLVSITAASDPFVAHAWLSEVLFAALFRVGGLALITVFTAILIGLTHATVAAFLKSKGADARWAIGAAFVGLAVSSTHWLARPHMFSILGAALTLYLLESSTRWRIGLFAGLFVIWANLHAGWLFGLGMIAAFVVGDLIEAAATQSERGRWLTRAGDDALAFIAAAAATVINPYGPALYAEVVGGATNSALAAQMAEFLPPNFQTAAPLPFLLAAVLSIAIIAITTKRLSAPHFLIFAASLVLGLRSFRMMALFGVTGWTIVALHVVRAWPENRRRFPLFPEVARLDPFTRPGLYAIPVSVVLLLIGLNGGRVFGTPVIRSNFSEQIFPVRAVASAREARLDGGIFESWPWGGYIMYAWPSARLIVDPLEFSDSTVAAYSRIHGVRPGWEREIERWRIRTFLIPPDTPLADALTKSRDWRVWYRDSTSVVFRRATMN